MQVKTWLKTLVGISCLAFLYSFIPAAYSKPIDKGVLPNQCVQEFRDYLEELFSNSDVFQSDDDQIELEEDLDQVMIVQSFPDFERRWAFDLHTCTKQALLI